MGLTLQCFLCPKQVARNPTVSERLGTTEVKERLQPGLSPPSTAAASRGSAHRPAPGRLKGPRPPTCAAGGQHGRAPRWGHPKAVRARLRRGVRPAVLLVPLVLAVGVPIADPLQAEAGVAGLALEQARGAAGQGCCGERTAGEEPRGSQGISARPGPGPAAAAHRDPHSPPQSPSLR